MTRVRQNGRATAELGNSRAYSLQLIFQLGNWPGCKCDGLKKFQQAITDQSRAGAPARSRLLFADQALFDRHLFDPNSRARAASGQMELENTFCEGAAAQ